MSTFALSLLGSRCRPKRFRIENGYFDLDALLCVDAIAILPFTHAQRRKSSTLLCVVMSGSNVFDLCTSCPSFFRECSNLMTFKDDALILVILGVSCAHDTSLGSHSSEIKKSFIRSTWLSQVRLSDVQLRLVGLSSTEMRSVRISWIKLTYVRMGSVTLSSVWFSSPQFCSFQMNSVCVVTLHYITLRWGKEDSVPLRYVAVWYVTSRRAGLG